MNPEGNQPGRFQEISGGNSWLCTPPEFFETRMLLGNVAHSLGYFSYTGIHDPNISLNFPVVQAAACLRRKLILAWSVAGICSFKFVSNH